MFLQVYKKNLWISIRGIKKPKQNHKIKNASLMFYFYNFAQLKKNLYKPTGIINGQ